MLASFLDFVASRSVLASDDGARSGRNRDLRGPVKAPEAALDAWLGSGPGEGRAPAARIDIDGDRVEIWAARPARDGTPQRADCSLDQADRALIGRIRHPSMRAQLIAARIVLRRALTHAVAGEVAETAWRFARTSLGRPYIEHDLPQVHFSVSHTQGLSVLAVSRERPVGIDVEAAQGSMDDEFIRTFLSRRERSALRRLPAARRQHAVIELWSLKEAYAKMLGIGLAADLQSFEFHLDPARLMSHCEAADGSRRTRFRTWQVPGPGGLCRLALAVGQPTAGRVH